jgi:hypothetical protein
MGESENKIKRHLSVAPFTDKQILNDLQRDLQNND